MTTNKNRLLELFNGPCRTLLDVKEVDLQSMVALDEAAGHREIFALTKGNDPESPWTKREKGVQHMDLDMICQSHRNYRRVLAENHHSGDSALEKSKRFTAKGSPL